MPVGGRLCLAVSLNCHPAGLCGEYNEVVVFLAEGHGCFSSGGGGCGAGRRGLCRVLGTGWQQGYGFIVVIS